MYAIMCQQLGRLIELRFYIPPDTKNQVISETFFPANLLAYYWKTKTNIKRKDASVTKQTTT